jgi:uncharacterized membrane protein
MNSSKLATICCVASHAALAIGLVATYPMLPERVASHFDAAGMPNGWMMRSSYMATYAFIGGMLQLSMVAVFLLIDRFPKSSINMPHRDYWLAPERSCETFAWIRQFGLWFATSTALLLLGVHLLVVQANLAQPVRLSPVAWGLLGAFLLTTLGGLIRMFWRFRVVPPATAAA